MAAKKTKAKAPARSKAKRGKGRPTDYDPAFCERVVALGSEGKSKAQIAAELGVVRQTLYAWAETYREFSDALNRAKELELAWWENEGQAGLRMGKDFNAAAFIFQMKNRFKEDYRDKQELGISGDAAFVQLLRAMSEGTGAQL